MVDAVVRRIEEEEAAAVQARLRHQADAQADIQHFLAQQQQLRKRCVGLAESQFRGRFAAVSGPTASVSMAGHLPFVPFLTRVLSGAATGVCFCRQREAEAAEEAELQEYLRRRREREAQEAARQANKREAQDRCWVVCV